MPSLPPEATTIIRALSEPIDQARRADFMAEATRRLEASPIIGAGTAHQIARVVQRDYFTPPLDQRRSRIGPRRS